MHITRMSHDEAADDDAIKGLCFTSAQVFRRTGFIVVLGKARSRFAKPPGPDPQKSIASSSRIGTAHRATGKRRRKYFRTIAPADCWSPECVSRTLVCADRKSTRLNSSHVAISYAVFCLKKKNKPKEDHDIYKFSR